MFKSILLRQKKQPITTNGTEIAGGSHVCYSLGSEPLLLPDGELLAAEMNEERLKVMELIQIYENDHLLLADGETYLSIYKTY